MVNNYPLIIVYFSKGFMWNQKKNLLKCGADSLHHNWEITSGKSQSKTFNRQ